MSVMEPSNSSIMEIVNNAPNPTIVADLCIEHIQGSSPWAYSPLTFHSASINSCDVFGFICLNFGLEVEVVETTITNIEPNFIFEHNTGLATGPLGDQVMVTKFGYAMLGWRDEPAGPDGFAEDDNPQRLMSPFIDVEEIIAILHQITQDEPVRMPWIDNV